MRLFTFLFTALILLLTLAACQNKPASTNNNSIAYPASLPASLANKPANVSDAQSLVSLNPEHGKPGHRCDIAVGAPLNSIPAPNPIATNNNLTTSPVITNQQTAPQPVAPGMNPQHGQPGHRCDIAVGAPLNSKPAPTSSSTIPTVPSPAKPDSSGS